MILIRPISSFSHTPITKVTVLGGFGTKVFTYFWKIFFFIILYIHVSKQFNIFLNNATYFWTIQHISEQFNMILNNSTYFWIIQNVSEQFNIRGVRGLLFRWGIMCASAQIFFGVPPFGNIVPPPLKTPYLKKYWYLF